MNMHDIQDLACTIIVSSLALAVVCGAIMVVIIVAEFVTDAIKQLFK